MKYIGSSRDDSIGCGEILTGTDYRKTDDGWELYTDQLCWVECYSVMILKGSVDDVT